MATVRERLGAALETFRTHGRTQPVVRVPATAKTLDFVLDELVRQQDRQSQVLANLHTRATILIGAASIAAALLTGEVRSWSTLLGIGLLVVTFLLGLMALLPRLGEAPDASKTAIHSLPLPLIQAKGGVLNMRIGMSQGMDKLIRRSYLAVRWGIVTFTVAWVVLVVGFVTESSIYAPEPPLKVQLCAEGGERCE